MANGVYIPMTRMKSVSRGLTDVITEFEEASSNQDGAADAIGTPADKTELKSAMGEFESAWDDRRTKLKRQLQSLQEHIDGLVEGFENGDIELASSLDSSNCTV